MNGFCELLSVADSTRRSHLNLNIAKEFKECQMGSFQIYCTVYVWNLAKLVSTSHATGWS